MKVFILESTYFGVNDMFLNYFPLGASVLIKYVDCMSERNNVN